MRLARIVVLGLCALVVAAPSYSMINRVGTAGALFLKVGMNIRSAGMGEATTAVVGDASSVFSNPAALASLEKKQVLVSDAEWLAGIRFVGGVFAFPYGSNGAAAVSAICVDYGEMPMVSEQQADVVAGTFRPRDLALGISYARRWTDRLMVGGSFKYIDESIAEYHSKGVAFDFGTVYFTGFRSLRLAMSTNNFGPDMSFDGSYVDKYYIGTAYVERAKVFGGYDLPLNFRVGLAYDFELSPTSMVTAAVDATHPNDYSERVHLGAEYSWGKTVFLRAGYITNAEEMDFSAGCGFNLKTSLGTAAVDYAYTNFGVFKAVHRFGVGVSF
jgi:long-subunit fatty acid transport protein